LEIFSIWEGTLIICRDEDSGSLASSDGENEGQ